MREHSFRTIKFYYNLKNVSTFLFNNIPQVLSLISLNFTRAFILGHGRRLMQGLRTFFFFQIEKRILNSIVSRYGEKYFGGYVNVVLFKRGHDYF